METRAAFQRNTNDVMKSVDKINEDMWRRTLDLHDLVCPWVHFTDAWTRHIGLKVICRQEPHGNVQIILLG